MQYMHACQSILIDSFFLFFPVTVASVSCNLKFCQNVHSARYKFPALAHVDFQTLTQFLFVQSSVNK